MDPNDEGPIYTAEQIKIPPELPEILKNFTKAAIRSQPSDLLQWSAALVIYNPILCPWYYGTTRARGRWYLFLPLRT